MAEQVSKFSTTRVIHHGPGALAQLPGEIRKLGGTRVALVTDPGVARAGLADRVRQAAGCELAVFAEVEPEPPYPLVHQCVDFIRANGCDLVIGLGGGSSMDVAKMAAAMMANSGSVADYWGVGFLPRPGLPVIAIPTTAGTSSEISPACVFVDPEARAKKGVRSDFLLPEVAILDAELTLDLPPALTASTGMDALVHAIESYTSPKANLVSEGMAERAIQLIGSHLRRAYANGHDLSARVGMFAGCLFAGMTLAEVNVGAVHALAQSLGGRFPVGHGLANALFLPYVMEFNRPACREKYARVAELLGEPVAGLSLDEASRRGVDAVRQLSLDIEIPQRLSDIEVPEGILDEVATACMATQMRILTNNPRTVSLAQARAMLRAAY